MNFIDTHSKNKPKISIGMPVYNGEKFIRQSLDSLLNQTLTDLELIISDNASNDSTPSICEEYLKKDKRIRYFRQEKNMGPLWNYNFVLEQAKCDFFMWAAVDDLWESEFVEKNVSILLSNKNVVGCVSKVSSHSISTNELKTDKIDFSFQNFLRKIRSSLKSVDVHSVSGPYDKKVTDFLRKGFPNMLYAVYRTDKLQECIPRESFVGNGYAIILSILQYGDFHVLDEELMSKYDSGLSSKGIISVARLYNNTPLGIAFPQLPLTRWCAKNLGKKLFFKNIIFFIQLNLWGEFTLLVDLVRLFIHSLSRKRG